MAENYNTNYQTTNQTPMKYIYARMNKVALIWIMPLFLFTIFTSKKSLGQCTNLVYTSPYPSATQSCPPALSANWTNIVTNAYRGEYSLVSVIEGLTYQFESSVTTDITTITQTDNTVLAFGTPTATWTATFTGNVRFWTHGAGCATGTGNRTRRWRVNDLPFGDYTWNVYGFNNRFNTQTNLANDDISALNTYFSGRYTQSLGGANYGFNSTLAWGINNSPSSAPGWSGCSISNDDFTFIHKRRGFPCGRYTLFMREWDDVTYVRVNGVNIPFTGQGSWFNNGPGISLGDFDLDENTTIEVRTGEGTGGAQAVLNITYVAPYGQASYTAPAGDPSVFGNGSINQWNVYAYRQLSTSNEYAANLTNYLSLTPANLQYLGNYTHTTLNINSASMWGGGVSPSHATGYQGYCVPLDNHVFVYKRRGFPCGNYTLADISHDDAIRILINGVQVWNNTTCCTSAGTVWTGYLDGTSTVEIRLAENRGGSSLGVNLTYVPVSSNPPTSVTSTHPLHPNYCHGNSLNLTSVGGTPAGGDVVDVWYKGGYNNAFTETWSSQSYTSANTTVNSTTGGILNVTSTNGDPMINMYQLGSFDPNTYRYINIRYRVTSGTANGMQIFYTNGLYGGANADQRKDIAISSTPLNTWKIVSIDMGTPTTGNWLHSNVTGWRFDWATNSGVTMDIDFIQLSQYPMIDEDNTNPQLQLLPSDPDYPAAGNTIYATAKISNCGVTPSASTTVTLPPMTNVLATDTEAATCIVNANETVHFYNTTSGRYISTVSANATGLGSTTATTYIDVVSPAPNAAPILTNACTDPSFQTVTLGRHWVITPATNTSATVRLPYYNPELTAMYTPSTTSSSPYDNISSQAQLGLSKYSGPANINNQWSDNCSGTTTWQAPTGSGNLSAYVPGWPANTDRYSMFDITGFSEFWLHASNTIVTPLSVVLSDFSVSCESKAITWTTASEQSSSHFVLEQSRNGYDWSTITIVEGAGTTNTVNNYFVNDKLSASYYRLKQVDFDGKSEYFGPVHVDCGAETHELTVYPNPANGTFTVAITSAEKLGETTIFLNDLSGKTIAIRNITVLSGTNTVQFENNNLVPGTYIISVQVEEKNSFTPVRLVIQ